MRGEIAIQGRPAAGVRWIQQEVFEIHCDELDRAHQLVTVRAAVAEGVVRGTQAQPHRADLPARNIEQARIARQLALRRAVVEVRQFVDDGRERRTGGRILDAGIGRTYHPAVEQRAIQQQPPCLCAAVGLRRQIVAPFHFNALLQRVHPCGGQALDGVSQEFPRGRSLGRCQ